MKILYILFAFLALTTAQAQAVNADAEAFDPSALQIKPEYQDGLKAFYSYFSSNFRTPEVEEDMTAKIVVSFVVERDGTLSNVKAIKDPGYGMGDEAVRVIKSCPGKWKPGIQNGKTVRAQYMLPVTLKIAGAEKEQPEPEGE